MQSRKDPPSVQFSSPVPVTPAVRWLLIVSVGFWLLGQVILEQRIIGRPIFTYLLGLVPLNVVERGFIWQFLTYIFLHSEGLFHILFNGLLLWWTGSELESRWGWRYFLSFYLVSGVGAGVIYVLVLLVIGWVTGSYVGWTTPVVGASGAIFGLLYAYGVIYGDRIVHFLMLFPMRARYFVMILGLVEFATALTNGIGGSSEANLAHLGGLASGAAFLHGTTLWKQRRWRAKGAVRRKAAHLRAVDSQEDPPDRGPGGPKYWN